MYSFHIKYEHYTITSLEWHSHYQTVFTTLINCGFCSKLFHLIFFFCIPCNSFIQHVWIGRKGDSNCWQMKTDTGMIERAGDCNDQKNYICEIPASTTSTFSIIHIEKVTLAHYCKSSPSSIQEPWTTLFYAVNCLFIRQQPHKTLSENCYFFSKMRNVHYVFPIKLSFRIFWLKSIKF